MSDLHLVDVSEFQPNIDWQLYARHSRAAVARVHNGHRTDRAFGPGRLQGMRASLLVRGFYGYCVANRDAWKQGREFAAALGHLQPGEFAVCDLEEGVGDQSGRAESWCAAVDGALGGHAWVYSGESFWTDHLTGVSRHRWLASYGTSEPRGPHVLWQHTDREQHRGIGAADCSIFHGTVDQLRAVVDASQGRKWPPPPAVRPAPKPQPRPPAPAVPPSKGTRMLVKFSPADVWEVVGSHLEHVTQTAWQARGLRSADVVHLPDTHPLNSLPKVRT